MFDRKFESLSIFSHTLLRLLTEDGQIIERLSICRTSNYITHEAVVLYYSRMHQLEIQYYSLQ